jgi:hypothetical protein
MGTEHDLMYLLTDPHHSAVDGRRILIVASITWAVFRGATLIKIAHDARFLGVAVMGLYKRNL